MEIRSDLLKDFRPQGLLHVATTARTSDEGVGRMIRLKSPGKELGGEKPLVNAHGQLMLPSRKNCCQKQGYPQPGTFLM